MKTCYLHLGFHKTATTSFQLSCGNNREKLLEEGIYYPKFEYKERKGNRWNHSGNIRFLCQTKTRRKLPKKKLLNQIQFKKALKRSDNLLLSGEGFSCMKREELEILKKYLEDHGFMIKAFGLVRSPYSFACSALQQTIKTGRFHSLIGLGDAYSPYISKKGKNYLPERSQQIERLLDIFKDDLKLYSFKQALSHEDGPVSFLLNQVNPSLSSRLKEDFKNSSPSLTNLQARLMNATNRCTSSKLKAKEKISKKLFRAQMLIVREQTKQAKGEKFLLTEKEFQLVEAQYEKISRKMVKLLGTTFVQENIQFSNPQIDPAYLAKSFAECASALMMAKAK